MAAQALTLINQIYAPFLFVLIFWLFLVFLCLGLFAPPNLTVVASLVLSSLTVTGAIYLILGDPMHHSWLQISGEPLQRALSEIGHP